MKPNKVVIEIDAKDAGLVERLLPAYHVAFKELYRYDGRGAKAIDEFFESLPVVIDRMTIPRLASLNEKYLDPEKTHD